MAVKVRSSRNKKTATVYFLSIYKSDMLTLFHIRNLFICQRGGDVRVDMLRKAVITSSSFSSKIASRFSGTNSLRPGRKEERRARC